MLRFLGNSDDDVSLAMCEFATEYISLLKCKSAPTLSDTQKRNIEVNIMHTSLSDV